MKNVKTGKNSYFFSSTGEKIVSSVRYIKKNGIIKFISEFIKIINERKKSYPDLFLSLSNIKLFKEKNIEKPAVLVFTNTIGGGAGVFLENKLDDEYGAYIRLSVTYSYARNSYMLRIINGQDEEIYESRGGEKI